jgi:deoxyribonuclease-4
MKTKLTKTNSINSINSINSNNKYSRKKSKNNIIIGCHASISSGVLESIKYVKSIDGNAVQIFLGSNRSSSLNSKTKFTDEEINDIRKYITKNNICLIIHSIYLLNFCGFQPYSKRIKYAHDNLQYDLHYGKLLGAKCVVLHLGFKKDLPEDIAIKNLIANLIKIIKEMPKGIKLSLETSAGQGSQIGYTLEQLGVIWNGIKKYKNKVGICIDTAHIFVSGYNISEISGIKDYMNKFDELIGLENIINFHINDSRYELGARKDEHRGIGQGNIYNTSSGKQSLKYIKNLCQRRNIPMILETHGAGSYDKEGSHTGKHGYEYEIEFIKKL